MVWTQRYFRGALSEESDPSLTKDSFFHLPKDFSKCLHPEPLLNSHFKVLTDHKTPCHSGLFSVTHALLLSAALQTTKNQEGPQRQFLNHSAYVL